MTAYASIYAASRVGLDDVRAVAAPLRARAGAADVLALLEHGASVVRIHARELANREGLRGYVNRRCAHHAADLDERIDGIVQELGIVIEPGWDDEGLIADFVWRLAERGAALVFNGSSLFDAQGNTLAEPLPGPSEEAEGHDAAPDEDGAEGDDEDDDEEPVEPPTAERVLHRAHALAAVSGRAFFERQGEGAAADLEALRAWMPLAVTRELERPERAALMTPLGSLDQQRAIDDSWRCEGLAVLAWALGVFELPDHETFCSWEVLAKRVGFGAADPPPALAPPRLRDRAELTAMAARLRGLHWRLREWRLRRQPIDWRACVAQQHWLAGFSWTGIALVDGDLAVDGVAIAQAEQEAITRCQLIVQERHRAIQWLCGSHTLYSQVDTPT